MACYTLIRSGDMKQGSVCVLTETRVKHDGNSACKSEIQMRGGGYTSVFDWVFDTQSQVLSGLIIQ